MKKISIKKEFKIEIERLWNNPKFKAIDVLKRGYGIHDEIIENSILFIGINPSYSGKNLDTKNYFINLDQHGRTDKGILYPYFKKFVDISIKSEHEWSHFDLLFFKETKQKFIDELQKKDIGSQFINEQLQISKKIIQKANPKLIVVSNTKARDFMVSSKKKISMGFNLKFDKELGTCKIIDNSTLNNVPVFFTSMLTGQRALDNGSYKRLLWHISFVLDKIKDENKINSLA